MAEGTDEVAAILASMGDGDPDAAARLLPFVYGELRASARGLMRGESTAHTLQPTALVHEAFVRLVNARVDWKDRAHFLAISATEMRRVLVEHARRRNALKRGGERNREVLDEAAVASADGPMWDVDGNEVLVKLAAAHERAARVFEMRHGAGLSVEHTAALLGVAERTVELDTTLAETWLKRELGREID